MSQQSAAPAQLVPAFMDQLAAEWNSAQVRWSLLREARVEGVVEGDIDVLVHPADLDQAVAIGRELGAARLVSQGRGSHTFLVAYSPVDRAWYEFDIVTEIAFGTWAEFPLMQAETLLASRQPVDGSRLFSLPAAERFWLNLLHCVLDKGYVSEHRAQVISSCARDHIDDALVGAAITGIVGPEPASNLASAGKASDWEALVAQAEALRVAFRTSSGATVSRRRRSGRIARALEKPVQWPSRRGLAVALLGPDGSGKSTLSGLIVGDYGFPIEEAYFGLWKSMDSGSRVRQLIAVPLRPFRALGLYLNALSVRWQGRSIVFDRYSLDARLPAAPPYAGLKDVYMWVVGHSCPNPDAVVLLDVPAEVMFARKGEMDVERLDKMRQDYAALAEKLRTPTLVVDGTQRPEAVAAQVVEFVWTLQRARLDRLAR